MANAGKEGDGRNGLRLVGYLKSNRMAAYVLVIMMMMHLSNQSDRYLLSAVKIPFVNYNSYEFALLVGPLFSAFNAIAGLTISSVGDAQPVALLCLACATWSISTGAIALCWRFWQVALARIGQGVSDAACNTFATSILREHFGPEVIGSAIGVYFTGLYAGFSLSLGMGSLMQRSIGWKLTYVLAGMGGLIVAIVAYTTVPEPQGLSLHAADDSAPPEGEAGDNNVGLSFDSPGYRAPSDSSEPTAFLFESVPASEGGQISPLRSSVITTTSTFKVPASAGASLESYTSSGHASRAMVRPLMDRSAVTIGFAEDDVGSGEAIVDDAKRTNGKRHRVLRTSEDYRRIEEDARADERRNSGEQTPLRSQSMSPLDSSDGTPPQPQAVPRTPWLDVLSGAKMISRRPRCFQREHCLNFRQKLSVLSKAWLGSPSLLLVCIAGGIRDAGGYVFGYYLPTYFSPLMASNPSLTANDNACSFSYSDAFDEEQICNEEFEWCIEGSCYHVTSSPWHNVGMPSSHLESFISWVPLVAGSLGAMLGGFLSDRAAQQYGTASRLWVVAASNALATPFAVGVLLAPHPWCFICLFGAQLLGEMWIGVSVAVVMSLVPRRVRIMSVALYNFIITNISGLSTTLVPLLEDFYGSSHVFRIVAEPKAGELPLGNSTHTALGSRVDSLGYTSMGELSEITTVDMPSRADALHESGVEFEIPGMGSKPLQAAMLWMYPGFFLASSVFCVAAAVALKRDQRSAGDKQADAGASTTNMAAASCGECEEETESNSDQIRLDGSADGDESNPFDKVMGMGRHGEDVVRLCDPGASADVEVHNSPLLQGT